MVPQPRLPRTRGNKEGRTQVTGHDRFQQLIAQQRAAIAPVPRDMGVHEYLVREEQEQFLIGTLSWNQEWEVGAAKRRRLWCESIFAASYIELFGAKGLCNGN